MISREETFEVLSIIAGHKVTSIKDYRRKYPGRPSPRCISPEEFVIATVIPSLFSSFLFSLLLGGVKPLLHGLKFLRLSEDEPEAIQEELFIDEDAFLDPQYDYDFTNVNDEGKKFKRGDEPYERPCGWMRIALKVLDKYPDGNEWLGTGPDAWPVSYHGTSKDGAKGIIQAHYKAGSGASYGRGVYSTPDIDIAGEEYSKTFTSEITGKTYKVVLQNRINPEHREKFKSGKYWLVPVPEGTSASREKRIVERAIRPYGLLVREV